MMATLNINIPEEVIFVLKKDKKALEKDISKMLALKLFSERRLSLGKCAELAEMSKNDFVDYLGENSIDVYRYTEEEFRKEVEFISKM